jgi:hypothetical protein
LRKLARTGAKAAPGSAAARQYLKIHSIEGFVQFSGSLKPAGAVRGFGSLADARRVSRD